MLRDILNRRLVTVSPDAKVIEAARLMEEANVGSVLVLDNDKPRGILTDRDIVVRCIAQNVDVTDCTVENILSESLVVCHETDGIFDCIRRMREAKVRRMPVLNDQGKVVGIVSFGDLMAMLGREMGELTQGTTPAEDHFKAA